MSKSDEQALEVAAQILATPEESIVSATPADDVKSKNTRTTRPGLVNFVKNGKLILHVEMDAKADKKLSAMWDFIVGRWSLWGNGNIPSAEKRKNDKTSHVPLEIKLDAEYTVYLQILGDAKVQCSSCGIWKSEGKSSWCPECQGTVTSKSDSFEMDF